MCFSLGLVHVHVISHGVDTWVHFRGLVDQPMVKGIPFALQTDEENTDTSETEIAQEQSVQERAYIPILQLENQHLNQVYHKVYDLSLPRFCPSSRYFKSASPSWSSCIIKVTQNTGTGNKDIVGKWKNIPLSSMIRIMLKTGLPLT